MSWLKSKPAPAHPGLAEKPKEEIDAYIKSAVALKGAIDAAMGAVSEYRESLKEVADITMGLKSITKDTNMDRIFAEGKLRAARQDLFKALTAVPDAVAAWKEKTMAIGGERAYGPTPYPASRKERKAFEAEREEFTSEAGMSRLEYDIVRRISRQIKDEYLAPLVAWARGDGVSEEIAGLWKSDSTLRSIELSLNYTDVYVANHIKALEYAARPPVSPRTG